MYSNEQALRDKVFLKKLDEYAIHQVQAKIMVINYDEAPIGDITGSIETGNISIDGSAACRRTCQLTLFTEDTNVNDLDWQLHSKYKLQIGKKNFVDSNYPEWIWFKMGTYVLTEMSLTNKLNGFQIQITGKDKTCLLDGTVGGALFADHDFAYQNVINNDEGTTHKEAIPIYDMIREAVHVYAKEPYWNIVINDLEDVSVELLDYKLDNMDAYLYDVSSTPDFAMYDSNICFEVEGNELIEHVFNFYDENLGKNWVRQYNNHYYRVLKKLTKGDTAGYRLTDLTYPEELVIQAGGTIVDMLNKVIEVLGEYEFFYDINGRFIFRRKQIYHNVTWTGTQPDEAQTGYYTSAEATQTIYDFTNSNIIESFSNKPKMTNIKNDYAIWGKLGTANKETNEKWPFHLRYAIDDQPKVYHCLSDGYWYIVENYDFESDTQNQAYLELETLLDEYEEYCSSFVDLEGNLIYPVATIKTMRTSMKNKLLRRFKTVDWRELLYRMAIDYQNAQLRIKEFDLIAMNSPVALYNIHLLDNPSSLVHSDTSKCTVAASIDMSWYFDTHSSVFKPWAQAALEKVNYGIEDDPEDNGRVGRGQTELSWIDWVKTKPNSLWCAKSEEIGSNVDGITLYDLDFENRTSFEGTYVTYGIEANWQVYGMKCIGWQSRNVNGRTRYSPVISITKHDTFTIINRELKQWEDRLNSGYAIYFSDMLAFWTLYYKIENDLTKDSIPQGFTAGLSYSSQMLTLMSSSKFATYENSFYNNMKLITQNTSKTIDEKLAWRNSYIEAYRNNLNSLKTTFLDYQSDINDTRNDAAEIYKEFYGSVAVDRVLARCLQYINDQLAALPNAYDSEEMVEQTKVRYNTFRDELDTIVKTFDAEQEVFNSTVVQRAWATWEANGHWNPDVIYYDKEHKYINFLAPESMLFWIDFMDTNSELGKYKISAIGHRAKVVNDEHIKAIFYREVPGILWINPGETLHQDTSISYARLRLNNGLSNYFKLSQQGKNAKDMLDTLIYESTNYQETITVSCVPIYWFEPNQRIRVVDLKTGISGEYIIKSFTYQLKYDGMMNIQAYRAADRLI